MLSVLGFKRIILYSLFVGITVNYKSRGGEWSTPIRVTAFLYVLIILPSTNKCDLEHADLSLNKQFSFIAE
jgi:hypothetical protein